MRQCFRVYNSHRLGLFLLILALLGIISSCFLPDWQRSVAEIMPTTSLTFENNMKATEALKFEFLCNEKRVINRTKQLTSAETNNNTGIKKAETFY